MSKLKLLLSKGINIVLQPPTFRDCLLSKKSKVCSGSNLTKVGMDDYSYMGHNCFCVNTQVGRFVSISDNCSIGGEAHPLEFVSTSPVFHEGKNVLKKNFSQHRFSTSQRTYIGNDVWIGMGVHVKAGVKINNGAVIGMGSVVTKDIGPYEIWAGNPARLIRKRFDDETIRRLLKTQWWTWDDDRLKKYGGYFNDIEKFLEHAEMEKTE